MSNENSQHEALRLHDPEAMLRENASLRERLAKLEQQNVVEGRFVGEAPRYLINDPGVYVDETHWPGGTTLDYIGDPNLSMVPLNEPAKRKMDEFIERLTLGAQRVAMKNGREFIGLHNIADRNQLLDLALSDAKRQAAETPTPVIQVPEPTSNIPTMPHLAVNGTQRRGPGRPPKVVASQAASPNGHQDLGAPRLAPAPTERAIVGRMVSS